MFHVDGRTDEGQRDGQTDMTELVFRNFANVLKNYIMMHNISPWPVEKPESSLGAITTTSAGQGEERPSVTKECCV